MPTIRLPHNWKPRPYQMGLWKYLENGGKRAVEVAHRRWGKDDVALHWTAIGLHQRVGNYWHMLPAANQARKAIWEAVNPHTGKRRIDEAFPKVLRTVTRENEMLIRFLNGSTWQVVGSDNYDSLVGSPPIGIVFSEFALADPHAWAYLSPILEENGGWAFFIYTPRGRNHGETMYSMAKNAPGWFAERLTAEQTGVFTPEQLKKIQDEYQQMFSTDGLSRYRQEYLCDFEAAVVGAYYGNLLSELDAKKRITQVSYDPALLVHTAWDLGIGDSTTIWFAQFAGTEIRLIDYHEADGEGMAYYAKMIREKPYVYGDHILPHDGAAKMQDELGKTRQEILAALGIKTRILQRTSVDDGINAVRTALPRCWFDAVACKRGIDALRGYRKIWNEQLKVFGDRPLHSWESHGADAFRYLIVGMRETNTVNIADYSPRPKIGVNSWQSL